MLPSIVKPLSVVSYVHARSEGKKCFFFSYLFMVYIYVLFVDIFCVLADESSTCNNASSHKRIRVESVETNFKNTSEGESMSKQMKGNKIFTN